MMLWYQVRLLGAVAFLDLDEAPEDLFGATVLLQHADGALGFDCLGGDRALEVFLGSSVVLQAARPPEWIDLRSAGFARPKFFSLGFPVISCVQPAEELCAVLDLVSINAKREKNNALRRRYGKPVEPLTPTMFDDWVVDGRFSTSALLYLLRSSRAVAVWSRSEWGLFAHVLGATREEAAAYVVNAADVLRLPAREVRAGEHLPSW